MTTTGSAASLPHGNRSSGPRCTKRKVSTARPESPMLTNEYRPSKTIMLDPLTIPQTLEKTANPAEAQTENSSSRRSSAAGRVGTLQDSSPDRRLAQRADRRRDPGRAGWVQHHRVVVQP